MWRAAMLVVLTGLVSAAAPADRPDADAKALRGSWNQTNGDRSVRWEFTDDGSLIERSGQKRAVATRSTVKLDARKDPRHITWDNGIGIYKLKENELTVCLTPDSDDEKDRPKRFEEAGGKHQLYVFKRTG